MKIQYPIAIALGVVAFAASLSATASKTEYIKVTETETVYEQKGLTPAQTIWLAKLMDCESGIYAGAINPEDLDGTPSHGILQFKPQTFSAFTAKYDIEGELMNPEAQVQIVTHWILNPGEVRWEQQFPACVRKLGQPPTNP